MLEGHSEMAETFGEKPGFPFSRNDVRTHVRDFIIPMIQMPNIELKKLEEKYSKLNLTSKKSVHVNLPSAALGKRASRNGRSPRSSARRFMGCSSAPWSKGTILFPMKVTRPGGTTPDPRRCAISSAGS